VNSKKRTWKELSKHLNTKCITLKFGTTVSDNTTGNLLNSEKTTSVSCDTDTDDASILRKQITEMKDLLDGCLIRQK
jgi:hypothetical protein